MESYKYDYEQNITPAESRISSGKEDDGRLSSDGLLKNLRKLVAVTAAALTVSGPLLVGMGVTLALTVSLAVIGLPLMLIFSPLLIFPTFILVTAVAGFSVSALLALAGISTLNWVFQSIRQQYQMHDDDQGITSGKATAMNEEEEDTAAKTLAKGWILEQEKQQQNQSQSQQQQEEQGQKQQQHDQGQKQQSQQQQQDQGQKPQPQQQQQDQDIEKEERGGVRGSDAAPTEETAEKGDTKEDKSEKQQEEDVTNEHYKSATAAADTSEKSAPKSKRPTTKSKK